ncbi:MAG: NUDIX hydrolase [Patescibacteria group bacterium]|nr:NUDIX hydrolase [Patescibacteria group bacterium]
MNNSKNMRNNQRFCVYLLYDQKRRFLLQLRSKSRKFLPHYWCFFGGRVHDNETPYESLKRKAIAELNYDVKNAKYVLSTSFDHVDFRSILHIFVEEYAHQSNIKLKDGENWGWFNVSQLDTIKMQTHDRALVLYIDEWLKNQRERDVSAIMLYNNEDRILLQQREDTRQFLPGYWSFFGGGLDPEENSYDALLRETKEELDYHPMNPRLILKTSIQHEKTKANLSIYLDHCTNPASLKLQEGKNWGWFTMDEVEKLKMLPSDKYILSYIFEHLARKRELKKDTTTAPKTRKKEKLGGFFLDPYSPEWEKDEKAWI